MFANETRLSRRSFLAGTVKTTAGIWATGALGSFRSFGAESAAKRATKVRFGWTTYTWGKDWDIPTIIANCKKAQVFGTELRTSSKYAHGVELELSAEKREEAKKQFKDSPVALVSIATSERFDWPDEAKLKAAIEATKGYLKLSRDVGSSGVRVFPNQFQPNVPHEKTVEQIAKALNEVGPVAADLGQEVRLEAHGAAGDLATLRAIMDRVTQKSVRVKLNSDARDAAGKGFEYNFNLVKDFLGHTVHVHDFKDPKFPNQLQVDLLVKMNWDGWMLLETSDKVEDRVAALTEQRELFEKMLANALKA
jgi:sugar phosphate isomerase/epimerase